MVAPAKIIESMRQASHGCFVPLLRSVIALLMGGAAATLSAAGWPGFRGDPGLTGVADGALPGKPALLWTYKTGGPVKSSAVIGGGKVFIGSNDGQVHALDFASGKELWSIKAGAAVDAAPLLANGTVFVGTIEGLFYALEASTGKQLWKYATEGKIMGSANLAGPNGGATRVLIGSYDFKLYCLDATNGKPLWTYETGNYINGSCAVANGLVVFGGCDAWCMSCPPTPAQRSKRLMRAVT